MNDSPAPHPYRTDSRTPVVDAYGVDTLRINFRSPTPEIRHALDKPTVLDALTGEVLRVVHKKNLRLVKVSGVTVMTGISKNGILWAAVEGRMESMLTGASIDRLAAPHRLSETPLAASSVAARVGVDLLEAIPVLARADLTADVALPSDAHTALALRAFDRLPLPRLQMTRTTQRGSTVPASVTWGTRRIALRMYDKKCSRPHLEGQRPILRIERQWVPDRSPIIDATTHQRLPVEFSRLLRPWLTCQVSVPADGRAICEHLITRVPAGPQRERLVGAAVLFEHVGEAAFKDRRAAVRKRASLLDVQLGPGVTGVATVGVAPIITAAVNAWESATGVGQVAGQGRVTCAAS